MGLDGGQGGRTELVPSGSPALDPGPVPHQATRRTAGTSLANWVAQQRPPAEPGIYRYGHLPSTATDTDEPPQPAGALLLRAAANVLVCLLAYRYGTPAVMYTIGYLGWFRALSPDQFNVVETLLNLLLLVLFLALFGRMGRWLEVYRRFLSPMGFRRNVLPLLSKAVTDDRPAGAEPARAEAVDPALDPWAELRQAGLGQALAVVEGDTRAGRVGDVDYVRIHRVWREVLAEPALVGAFGEQVAVRGRRRVRIRRRRGICRGGWRNTICCWDRCGWGRRRRCRRIRRRTGGRVRTGPGGAGDLAAGGGAGGDGQDAAAGPAGGGGALPAGVGAVGVRGGGGGGRGRVGAGRGVRRGDRAG